MSFSVEFDKSNMILGGISNVTIENGRCIATYADGTTIDLGNYNDVNVGNTTNDLAVTDGVLTIADSSKIKNFATLYNTLKDIESEKISDDNAVKLTGDKQTISSTKVFETKINDATYDITIHAGTNNNPEIEFTSPDYESSVSLDYEKMYKLIKLANKADELLALLDSN